MTADQAAQLIADTQLHWPGVLRLARLVCLAVRVDAALLRRMRLRLAPELDPGVEGDLWFSPLVESQGAAGFVLEKEVATCLRKSLAIEPALLQAVEGVMSEERDAMPPSILLEEKLTALALRGAAGPEIEETLRPALLALNDPQRGADLARWAMRALPRFPPEVLKTEAAMMLSLGASARLGDRPILDDADVEAPLPSGAAWVLPKDRLADRTTIGVQSLPDGLRFSDPPGQGDPQIQVPRTEPRWIELSWEKDGKDFVRTVRVEPQRLVPLPEGLAGLTLRTLAGDEYRVDFGGANEAGTQATQQAPLWPAKIYLSTTAENSDFLIRLRTSLQEQGHEVVFPTDATLRSGADFAERRRQIELCDCFVGIVGWQYRVIPSEDDSEGKAMAESEFDHATALWKPRLIFMPEVDAVDVPPIEEQEEAARLKIFRERVASEVIPTYFASVEDLQQAVLQSIARHEWDLLARGMVQVSDKSYTGTGWLAAPDLVVTKGEDLPAPTDEEFRTRELHVLRDGRTLSANPAAWTPATGLLILRLREPIADAVPLPLIPPDGPSGQAPEHLTTAGFGAAGMRTATAEIAWDGEGAALKFAEPLSREDVLGLIGGPVLAGRSVRGCVSGLWMYPTRPGNTPLSAGASFADTQFIQSLLAEAAPRATPPEAENADPATTPLRGYIIYAHQDQVYRETLEKYLTALKRQGLVAFWDESKIQAGDEWEKEIGARLDGAQIVIVLISIDLIVSSFIQEKELPRAMERHRAQQAVVVPVLLRATAEWETVSELGTLQALPVQSGPQGGQLMPVSMWDNEDEAWTVVVRGVKRAIEGFRESLRATVTPAPVPPPSEDGATAGATDIFSIAEADPQVHELVEQLRRVLDSMREQLKLLRRLMELHDLLHSVEFQFYEPTLYELRRASGDEINWRNFTHSETTLGNLVHRIQATANQPPQSERESPWVYKLLTANQYFREAIEAHQLALLKNAVREIGDVLAREMPRIKLEISRAAASIPLPELAKLMNEMSQLLNTNPRTVETSSFLASSVTATTQSGIRMEQLIEVFRQGERIDSQLRLVASEASQNIEDLREIWSDLKEQVLQIDFPEQQERMRTLHDEISQLDTAFAAGDEDKIKITFEEIMHQTEALIYECSAELRKVVEEVARLESSISGLITPAQQSVQQSA